MDLIDALPLNDIESALDHYPVPYVVVASAGGAVPTIVNQNAGSPTRVDADRSKTTGKGGNDIQVEVNTELLPSPHLRVNINRITSPADATDVSVLIAFPFAAFNGEPTLPSPNLFLGYTTRASGGGPGGIAPLTEEFRLYPQVLGGISHDFQLTMLTGGQVNPMAFQAGHFDGDAASGIENAIGMEWLVEGGTPVVPNSIDVTINLDESALLGGTTASKFALDWEASSRAKVTFDYLEGEDFPFTTPDFNTTLIFDLMPTSETFTLQLDEASGSAGFTISHGANSVVDSITLIHERSDGLTITGTAGDVPTEVDLTVDLDGSAVTLDVNDNTLDLDVIVQQDGGFLATADFLGYDIGYVEVILEDAPDLTAGYISASNSFGITSTNGDPIGALGVLIGDDDNLELPSKWGTSTWHEFSLIDNGTNGTAAARVIDLITATLTLDASPTGETLIFDLGSRSPLELHLETTVDSQLTNEDIKVVCEVINMPMGDVNLTIDFPQAFAINAPDDPNHVIDSLGCKGNVGTLNFDTAVGQLPVGSGYDFDPNGKLTVTVGPGNGGYIGFIRSHLWDETNALPISLVPAQLMGALHDAQLRVDHIPSFTGTWSDGANTNFAFAPTDSTRFVDGMQVLVSTVASPLAANLPAANANSDHFLTFTSTPTVQTLGGGIFGLKNFSYASTDADSKMTIHYEGNAAHKLVIDVDSEFGGTFFPDYDIDATFTLDKIPATFDLLTEFDPYIQYTGSAGISSIALVGSVDNSSPDLADKTTVSITATGLPAAVTLNIDPDAGASLVMSGPLTQLAMKLTSNVGIFGGPYQLVRGTINNVPAKWNAAWGGNDFLLEAKDGSDNPAALGVVSARISRSIADDVSDSRLDPFKNAAVNRVLHSAFQTEIDSLYWPAGVVTRMDRLYNQGEKLDVGEDHVVVVKNEAGAVAFVDAQFTGFQKILIAPNPAGGDFEFNAPSPGVHPLFGGLQEEKADPTPDKFTLLQIGNIPDHQELHINIPAGDILYAATDDVDPSAGKIELYQGPLPAAGDGQDATRVVMNNTPSDVHITWNFGFPNGSALFDASNTFDVDFLRQDGSQRIVAGLTMQDVQLTYGIDILSFDVLDAVGFDPCEIATLGVESCPVEVPVEWELLGVGADLVVSPGLDGYVALYEFRGGLVPLSPSGTAPDGSEYVPQLTGMVKDFTGASVFAGLSLDILSPNLVFPLSLTVDVDVNGSFIFDVWSNSDTDLTFDVPVVDYSVGYVNTPDYASNSPFHIFPGISSDLGDTASNADFDSVVDAVITFNGFHGFAEHFDPFAP